MGKASSDRTCILPQRRTGCRFKTTGTWCCIKWQEINLSGQLGPKPATTCFERSCRLMGTLCDITRTEDQAQRQRGILGHPMRASRPTCSESRMMAGCISVCMCECVSHLKRCMICASSTFVFDPLRAHWVILKFFLYVPSLQQNIRVKIYDSLGTPIKVLGNGCEGTAFDQGVIRFLSLRFLCVCACLALIPRVLPAPLS